MGAPGSADDGAAAAGVMDPAGTGRVHPPVPARRMDRRARDATLRVVAAHGDGRADARLVLRTDRAACAGTTSRRRQRLVFLLRQLAGASGPDRQPAADALAPRATSTAPGGHQPGDG